MMTQEPSYNSSLRIPASLYQEVKSLAKRLDISINTLMLNALREYLSKIGENTK